jgi:hypothetical protein
LSGQRQRKSRRPHALSSTDRALDLWWQAVDIRAGWLSHALCTEPADRDAAEGAIADLYALLDRPRPAFVWVSSPAAAGEVLPPAPLTLHSDGPWPLESQLATLVSTLRERLGAHPDPYAQPPSDPVAALHAGASLRSVLDVGVRGALRRVVQESIAGAVRGAAPALPGLTWYGQHDADWVAHYDVHRRVVGARFGAADAAQLDLWATLVRSCGWWWPREGVCVVAERPAVLRTEPVPGSAYGEVRLHDAAGPAVVFRDGWTVHSWHGTRVPSWVIDRPTVEQIAAERNVEVRRCAIERIGWAAFIAMAGLVLVGRAPDPGNPGCELRLYDMPPNRLLLAVNGSVERDGTRRRYGLRVPSWFDDPIDAAGWTYGLTGAQYAQLQRRT